MAYTYTGTPNQRIQQAQQRISSDGSVAINPTLSAYMKAAEQAQQVQQTQQPQSDADVGERIGDTLGDVAKNTLDGMLKAGEGLLDFGASTVGVIAGWFGNDDLKQRATDWSARDLVGEMWDSGRQNGLDVDFEDSYINDLSETGQNIVRGVAQGVGQMLPMVAVTLATGGTGTALATAGKIGAGAAKALTTVGKAINLVGLGMSAAGTSTERALNTEIVDAEGNVTRPTLDRAYLYGLASGAVEMATEKLVGGVFEKFTGTGLADKVISKLSKSVKFGKAVQFGLNVVGEGVEEMISEAVGKTLETIYNSPDGKMHWENPDMQDVIVSGIVGSLTASVMGGADVGLRKISNVSTAQDAMLDYENTKKKADNLSRQGKLTAEDVVRFDADNAKTLETISKRYQRASENGRAKIKAAIPGITELLNEDGTIKKTALIEGATEISAESAVNAMSGSLAVSRRTEVANALKEHNLALAKNLDSAQKSNMTKLEQALKLTGKKTGVSVKVVVAEQMPDNAHLKGDIMYISKDRLSSTETVAQDFAHEAFHFAEGSKEYIKMMDFLGSIEMNGKTLVDTAIEKVRNLGYAVDDSIFETIKHRESVSGKDAAQVQLAFSEINAKAAELLLGNADTINKLIERDRSLARKVLSNIRDCAKYIEKAFKGDAEGIETLKQMRKAIKLYEDALAASGERYLSGKVAANITQHEIDDNSTAIDNPGKMQYNLDDTNNGWGRLSKQEQALFYKRIDEIHHQKHQEYRLPSGEYVIDIENKIIITNGEFQRPSIYSIVEFAGYNQLVSEARDYFYEQITNGRTIQQSIEVVNQYCQEEVATFYGYEDGGNRREGNKQRINDNQDRNTSEKRFNGRSVSRAIGGNLDEQHSLRTNTDSQGRELTRDQLQFFKDSKVRNKDGNLLVVYHNTQNEFTVFDDSYIGTGISGGINNLGRGFYFTDEGDGYAFYGKQKAVYLDIKKPYLIGAQDNPQQWKKLIESSSRKFDNKMNWSAPSSTFEAISMAYGIYGENIKTTFTHLLKQQGYDGIIEVGGYSNDYVVFKSNQIKSITNTNPTQADDIRYSLRNENEESATLPANAEQIIKKRFGTTYNWREALYLTQDGDRIDGSGRKIGNIGSYGYRAVDHREISSALDEDIYGDGDDFMIEFINRGNIRIMPESCGIELSVEPTQEQYRLIQNFAETIGFKEKYFSVDISDKSGDVIETLSYDGYVSGRKVVSDIKYYFKEGKLPYRSDISRFHGDQYSLRENPTFTEEQRKAVEQELLESQTRIELRAADDIKYNEEYHRLIDKVWSEAVSLSYDNIKKYNNASNLMDNEFVSVIKKLSGIKYRGELKKGATRRIIADFGKWYNIKNPLLTDGLDEDSAKQMMENGSVTTIGYLDKFTLEAIATLEDNMYVVSRGGKTKGQKIPNNKSLSMDELRLVQVVLASARHVLNNYNSVRVREKRLVLSDAATRANNQAKAIAPHVKKRTRVGENVSKVIKSIIDPAALIGEMFGYQDNSPLVDSFQDIQDGATHAAYLTNSFTDIIDDFLRTHKNYKKHLADKIKVGNHEIRMDLAISLYMLSQQSDSVKGLTDGGWGYTDNKGYWIDCGKLTQDDIDSLSEHFSKSNADKEFVEHVRHFFDETGRMMADTDMQYKGYTLIDTEKKSDYYPIVRYSGDMAKPIADAEANKNIASVSVANYSFTKERVKNERRINIIPVLDVLNKHAREVGNYAGLAIPIKEFQRIYNCNIGKNGSTESIRNTINEQAWSGFNEYITTLLGDIQGFGRDNGGLARQMLNKITGNIATNALGFNLKTILSQISGYPAIYMYVSLDSMTKAMAHSTWYKGENAQNMLKYSEWAAVKAHDNGLILAETGAEKLGKLANFTTKGIQMMDNAINRLIWNACQVEVEKQKGLKFGTLENMVEAGKLHSQVGRMTQGNNARSELSAMQRSSNAIAKLYSMFNSDGFKYISRFYEAVKRLSAYRYLNKQNPDAVSQQKVKSAHTFVAKAATAVIVSNLVYCLMGQVIKFALNKDREDKEGNEISVWEDLVMDFMSSMVGMIPVVRDIYSLLVEGYEVRDNATAGIMTLAEAIKDVIDSTVTIAKGDVYDSSDIARPLKSLVDAIGLCTGLPTRNVYNYMYGFTKRFSPATAYEWNSIFYNNGYTKDLKKAMEKDDVDLQKTIIGLMLKDDGMTDTTPKVNERLRELYKQGYTVLPRTVKDTLNYNGEIYELSKRQQNSFKSIYGQANKEVEELVNNTHFSHLSAEIQAKSIKWIYDYYYENAVYNTVGEEAESKKQLFGEVMAVSKFAMTIAACSAVESKLDKKGNVVAGSRKQAIIKLLRSFNLSNNEILMILAYLGYSVEDNEHTIKNFVSRIGLSKSQQKTILKYCGFAA